MRTEGGDVDDTGRGLKAVPNIDAHRLRSGRALHVVGQTSAATAADPKEETEAMAQPHPATPHAERSVDAPHQSGPADTRGDGGVPDVTPAELAAPSAALARRSRPVPVLGRSRGFGAHAGRIVRARAAGTTVNVVPAARRGLGRTYRAARAWRTRERDFEIVDQWVRSGDPKSLPQAYYELQVLKKSRLYRRLATALTVPAAGYGGYRLAVSENHQSTLVLILLGLVLTFVVIGWSSDQQRAQAEQGMHPLRDAMTNRQVAGSVREALEHLKLTVVEAKARGYLWGWDVQVQSPALPQIPQNLVSRLEGALQTPTGSITLRRNRDNASVGTFRIVWRDVLRNPVAAPYHAPRSLTVTRPLPVAAQVTGDPVFLMLAKTHLMIIGSIGSGKTGALWAVCDALTACRDQVLFPIDLSTNDPFVAWRPIVGRRTATTLQEAHQTLTAAVTEMRGRMQWITREISEGRRSPSDKEWLIGGDGPQLTVVIDEFSRVAANKALLELVLAIIVEGRKAAVTVILCNQREVKQFFGNDTTITKLIQAAIYLAMDPKDALQSIDAALRRDGVRPELFEVSSGDDPKDAGRGYIIAPGVPVDGYRMFGLTGEDCHMRSVERGRYGVVTLPPLPGITAAATAPMPSGEHAHAPLPPLLAGMRAVIQEYGRGAATTAQLRRQLPQFGVDLGDANDALYRELSALLGTKNVPSSAQLGPALNDPKNPRGYTAEQVEQMIATWLALTSDNSGY